MFDNFSTAELKVSINAYRAYNGSLDAAKALHEAVLPGWDWCMTADKVDVWTGNMMDDGIMRHGEAGTTARAWLIAILKALIAEGEG